ncbi:hypothetical protein H2201_007727 [Coniosporium apollinis]|uniref:Uncharacterized protein n=1 Tax=Coniosporium apollinis TaxID=61459 RepID=A0ABQ9NLR4_9PEZI|nr:hypothetical protein H2201_007727 [Coniosporium apollinis]
MPHPPSTPTPHRFVLKRDPQNPPKPPPGRRNPTVQPTSTPKPRPTPKTLPTPTTSSQQFAQTPRFSFAQARSHEAPSTPQSTVSPASRPQRGLRSLTRVESIEDASQETADEDHGGVNGDKEMLDASDASEVQQTVEIDEPAQPGADGKGNHDSDEGAEEMLFAFPEHPTKRRRLSSSLSPPPDLRLPVRSPSKPVAALSPAPHSSRFLLHPSQPALSQVTNQQQPTSRRPAFRLPQQHQLDSGSREPLPDIFSPHRRGQKFVPGGMADIVRGWVMDVGSGVTAQGRAGRTRSGSEPVLSLQAAEVTSTEALTLVRGLTVDGKGRNEVIREKRAVLAGKARGGDVERVRKGDMVGIRAPSWDIEVKGETWSVGVDWRAFDGGGGEVGRG